MSCGQRGHLPQLVGAQLRVSEQTILRLCDAAQRGLPGIRHINRQRGIKTTYKTKRRGEFSQIKMFYLNV